MSSKTISAIRAGWYSLTEPWKLQWGRFKYGLTDGKHSVRPTHLDAFPLISVYIPTHQRVELLLGRALPSIVNQTYQGLFEVIVAAHGCTDETCTKAWLYLNDNLPSRAIGKVIHVPRKVSYPPTPENHWLAGPVVPANAALKVCRGQWIARIDDDDVWTKDHLETLLRVAQERDLEFISAAHVTHEGKVEPYDLDGVKVGGCQTWLYRSYLKSFRYNPDCFRKAWNRVNDTDLQDRFRKAGVRMGYIDKVTAEVLPRPGETDVGLKAYLKE